MLQIHSKKRNRLEHKRLHNLVYVKYNQALLRRYIYRDEIDPISLGNIKDLEEFEDIDSDDSIEECNKWLVGMMDGDEVDAGNERVSEDESDEDVLNWEVVFRASGVGEPTRYTRQRASGVGEPTRYTRQTTKKSKETLNHNVVGTSSKTKRSQLVLHLGRESNM